MVISQDRHPLILIPGLLNDADLWPAQVASLSDIANKTIADITHGSSLREMAEGILSAAPERFAVAGFSLGGYVVQEMTWIDPRQFTHVALLDTSIRADSAERKAMRHALDKAALAPGKFHGFGDRLLVTYLHPDHLGDPAIVERIRDMTERLGAEVFLRQNALQRYDGAEALLGLDCPVLIACGDSDGLTPLSDHEEMERLAPRSRLVVIPHSGHMTPLEFADTVNAALRDWLTNGESW